MKNDELNEVLAWLVDFGKDWKKVLEDGHISFKEIALTIGPDIFTGRKLITKAGEAFNQFAEMPMEEQAETIKGLLIKFDLSEDKADGVAQMLLYGGHAVKALEEMVKAAHTVFS